MRGGKQTRLGRGGRTINANWNRHGRLFRLVGLLLQQFFGIARRTTSRGLLFGQTLFISQRVKT